MCVVYINREDIIIGENIIANLIDTYINDIYITRENTIIETKSYQISNTILNTEKVNFCCERNPKI